MPSYEYDLFVIGGGSKNDHWIKLLASALNRDLAITEASEAMAAFGAARLAFLGFNNLNHGDALSPPLITKEIKKAEKQREKQIIKAKQDQSEKPIKKMQAKAKQATENVKKQEVKKKPLTTKKK